MPEVIIKAKVPANHRLTIDLSNELKTGEEVEVVVRSRAADRLVSKRHQLSTALQRLANSGRRADAAALDRRIRELRESWD